MQVELTALQPQLIQTSEETANMMVKIEEETIEADAKKLLVQADEKESNAAAAVAQGIKVQRGAGEPPLGDVCGRRPADEKGEAWKGGDCPSSASPWAVSAPCGGQGAGRVGSPAPQSQAHTTRCDRPSSPGAPTPLWPRWPPGCSLQRHTALPPRALHRLAALPGAPPPDWTPPSPPSRLCSRVPGMS